MSLQPPLLAIDPGSKRVGVAASTALGTVHPVAVLDAEPRARLLEQIAALAEERGCAGVVVGLPVNMDGSVGPSARTARRLGDAIGARCGLPVHYADERLTSVTARETLVPLGLTRKRRKARLDAVAASTLLEGYLAERAAGRGAGTDQQDVYQVDPAGYAALVAAEDADGHLAAWLTARIPADSRVLDVGCGTGRVTATALSAGASVVAVDRARPMLELASTSLPAGTLQLVEADAVRLPIASGSVDVAIAGWVFGHCCVWLDDWRPSVEAAVAELRRVLRPGGALIVIESLGTAVDQPSAPTPALADYHDWLAGEAGLAREVIRTDYAFGGHREAVRRISGFFGPALAAALAPKDGGRVREFTGVWHGTAS